MIDSEDRYHYALVRRAIEALDTAGGANIALEDLAAEVNLSPSHFQRVFSRWAGVSPKKFQHYLALGHAKALLEDRFTTLETAHAVGLSGPGRLHDLFVKWEAMSPGEYASGGAGLTILWGCFDSPFGPALVMGTEKGICGIGFSAEMGPDACRDDLIARWPNAKYIKGQDTLRPQAERAFPITGPSQAQLYLIGAPFQIKVWEALLRIPTGHVTTYSEIAASVNNPRAVRAVGTAVGRNPISWLVPCHRALRKTGGLGGYHWGLPMKRAMLAYETARLDDDPTLAENRA
jgi:AraC family transcriptional regulator, regulatory protein of adaptative response / methylated-DNA-[protein]-cysteine methyltransferase